MIIKNYHHPNIVEIYDSYLVEVSPLFFFYKVVAKKTLKRYNNWAISVFFTVSASIQYFGISISNTQKS